MSDTEQFSSPHNWCDRSCEACLLSRTCIVSLRSAQRAWVHEARGEDPDDMSVVMTDVLRDLQNAVQLLQEAAVEHGIDLNEPVPEEPINLASERLGRSGLDLVKLINSAAQGCETEYQQSAEQAIGHAATLAAKIGRLTAYSGPDDPVWFEDGVPNLMLIEQLLVRVRSSLDAVRPGLQHQQAQAIDSSLQEVSRLLDGHLHSIPPEARALLSSLVRQGKAPSPFCTLEGHNG